MPKSDVLHELIQQLDKNEKRHFQLFARMYGSKDESHNYIQLFDLLAGQKTYDEQAVVDQLSNKVFAKNLSVGKNYLYHLVLKCLRHYHSGANLKFQIREMWMDIHLLLQKGLNNQAEKTLDKALKLTKDKGLYASYIEFSHVKRKLVLDHHERHKISQLEALAAEDFTQYQKLGAKLDILGVLEKTFAGIKDQNLGREVWDEIISAYKEKLKALEASGQASDDVLFYYFRLVQYYNYKNEYRSSFETDERAMAHLSTADQSFIKEEPGRYFAFLVNFFNVCVLLKKYERAEELIRHMEKVSPSDKEERAYFPAEIIYCRVLLNVLTQNYEEVSKLSASAHSLIQAARKKMAKSKRWAIYSNIGSSFMVTGNYSVALDWFGIIYQEQDNETSPLTQCLARMSLMICHHELGNLTFVESIEQNLVKFLRKQTREFKDKTGESFKALRHYVHSPPDKETRRALLQELVVHSQKELIFSIITLWASNKIAALS